MENPVMNIVRSKRSPSHVHEKTFDFEKHFLSEKSWSEVREKIGIEQNDLNCLEESWSADPNALNVDKRTDP